jgi:hypothetical protein
MLYPVRWQIVVERAGAGDIVVNGGVNDRLTDGRPEIAVDLGLNHEDFLLVREMVQRN